MSEPDLYATRPRRGLAWPLIGLIVAFALGIGLTAYAVRRWASVAQWIHPAPISSPVPAVTPFRAVVVPPPAVSPQAADPDVTQRLAVVESRLDAMEQRTAEASGDADRAEGLLVAFAARRALDRGQPLGYLEGMLRDRFGAREAAAVAMVIAAAQRPVTLAQLQDGFASLAPSLAAPAASESWLAAIRRELGSLFVVRRADQPSTIPDRTLARAEHALEQGQVDAAAAEVARLPGSPRSVAWLGSARRYVLSHAALDRLETAALLAPPADPVMAAAPLPATADQ